MLESQSNAADKIQARYIKNVFMAPMSSVCLSLQRVSVKVSQRTSMSSFGEGRERVDW